MEITRTNATTEVKALLTASALPVDDLDDPTIVLFAAFDGGRFVGVVGLQLLPGLGLLRSLAVDPRVRDQGHGGQLCDNVVRDARDRGLSELWLLTTSASDYFERRGFEPVPREQVPSAIRATAQYSTLCPSSAVVMRRAL